MKAITFKPIHSSERKKRLSKSGKGPVWICAYQYGKHKYYPTDISISPKQWNRKKGMVINHPTATAYNSHIKKVLSDLESYQMLLVNEAFGEHPSLNTFDKKFRTTGGLQLSFCDFYKERVLHREDISEATRQTQLNTLSYFKTALGDLSFKDLNFNAVYAFHQFLLGKGKSLTTIDKYHRHVKTYINLAISKGFIPSRVNPYGEFKYDKGRSNEKEFLRLDELKAIENMDITALGKEIVKARDIFLLMAYTGLRFSDAVVMSPKHITKVAQGYSYSGVMMKNKRRANKQITLPIHAFFYFEGEAESRAQKWLKYCIDKYSADNNTPFFDKMSNAKVNANLKIVAKHAKVKKHLTCHVGRHSFGTNMAVKVPSHLLQRYMGHSKIETTMRYVHMSLKIQDEVMERIRWEK